MRLRRAVLSDAPGIARVHIDSWRTTYKDIIPDTILRNLSLVERTDLWKRNMTKGDQYILVAVNMYGEIVGFAACRKRNDFLPENAGEITSLYLLTDYQGMGIGKQLLQRLFKQLIQWGLNNIFVEVLEENVSCEFYEYFGASLLQSKQILFAGTELVLRVYEWKQIQAIKIS